MTGYMRDSLGRRLDSFPVATMKRATRVDWLGDSLTANGSNQTSIVGTITATSAGATSVTFTNAYPAYPSQGTPAAGDVYVIDAGLATEERFVIPTSGVSGSAPTWTITTPALTYAHAAGAQMRGDNRQFGSLSVPIWTALLSGNRLRCGGIFAHGSYTAAQIQTVYLPQILAQADLPGVVVVNVGRNDVFSSGALTTYGQILDSLLSAGILPVVTSAPPANALSFYVPPKWNAQLHRECAKRGVPFIDIYSALVDDGTGSQGAGYYKSTYNSDNTHPSEIGAKAWAQAIVTAISSTGWFPFYSDTFAPAHNVYNGDTASYPMSSANAVMVLDSNSDGVPDTWTKTGGNAGDTLSLVTEPGVPGKMLSITRVAAGTSDVFVQSNSFTIVPGHKYRFFLRIKTSGVDSAYANQISTSGTGSAQTTSSAFQGFDVRLTNSPALGDWALFGLRTWKRDIPLTVFSRDFHVPAGLTSNTTVCLIQLRGSASSTAYTVEVQPFLVDLTAAGAA